MTILGIDLAQNPFLTALITGIIWSIYGYFTSTTEATFKLVKLAATVITAMFVVIVLTISGVPVDKATFEQQMVLFIALTVAIERLLTKIMDWFNKTPAVVAFLSKPQGEMNPKIIFNVAPTTGDNPLTVTFTDTSGLVSYWNFGDGVFNDTRGTVTHTYKKSGKFTAYGMQDSKTMSSPVIITVKEPQTPVDPIVPEKKSWLETLWAIIKAILHLK
jgi:hypothetical protein